MAQISPLSEGVFTIGHDKIFVPFNEQEHQLNDRPIGSLLVEVQPFMVVTHRDVIIFDTGLGFINPATGNMQIADNLARCGYSVDQVTKVLLSHLHKDHAAGVVHTHDGLVRTTFPNATYYIYRPEADYALATGTPSYQPADIEPLLATSQVHWLDGEKGVIDGYIHFTHSGGHCPQHIVYLIDDGIDKVFYGGDEAPQLKQMKMKYVAKYDSDGKKAMALREKYALQGHNEGWPFLFYHDVKAPIAKL
ncbi:MAG: MBL fold metallo-hydrolase [Bacteroidota bacterium]